MNKKYMLIDDVPCEFADEKNVLEVIRKANIDLPTFCYYSELSTYGACRMCVVEDKWGNVQASCSSVPKEGMEIYTNTERLRKYRKSILELLLSNHCRDCVCCEKSGNCKLQDLAEKFGIRKVRFENNYANVPIDDSSCAIVREQSKCILCGDCVRMCKEIQNVGAIDFVNRGSHMRVSTPFDEPLAKGVCVSCGQCAVICPTGALTIKSDKEKLWKAIDDENKKVIVQIAPAVRVGIGKALGLASGQNYMGQIVAALRKMGVDEIYDTSTGADFTVIEEAKELIERIENNKVMPMFTSCCPSWINYLEKNHPEFLPNVSTCRSPIQMLGSVIKEHNKGSEKKVVSVAIAPCTAKKFECQRDEFKINGEDTVDIVITTVELIEMIREACIEFDKIAPEGVDQLFGNNSGAGVIFGVTGGVTEAVARTIVEDKSKKEFDKISFSGVRGLEGIKEAELVYKDKTLKIAIVSGLKNAEIILEQIKSGEKHYDFMEVMTCPSGCIGGAGQPLVKSSSRHKKVEGLFESDRMNPVKHSGANHVTKELYATTLKDKEHELLHVSYIK
ncbi:MAG: [FeFe] hydrogenase, group A [Lachnospirales bacterium]